MVLHCKVYGNGIVLYGIVLYCIVLYCYCIVLYCIVLYCIVLYCSCIVLYCIVSIVCMYVCNYLVLYLGNIKTTVVAVRACTVLYCLPCAPHGGDTTNLLHAKGLAVPSSPYIVFDKSGEKYKWLQVAICGFMWLNVVLCR